MQVTAMSQCRQEPLFYQSLNCTVLAELATVSVATVAKFDDSMSQVAAISGATGNDLES